jgi:hypothetical protein
MTVLAMTSRNLTDWKSSRHRRLAGLLMNNEEDNIWKLNIVAFQRSY